VETASLTLKPSTLFTIIPTVSPAFSAACPGVIMPILGVSFDPTYTGVGARVYLVTPGKAAEKAGITVGLIVKKIDGFKINDAIAAIVRIRSHAPGDQVTIVVESSAGSSKTYTITLDSAPALP